VSRMEASEKRRIIEALILSSTEPISAMKLAEIIPYCKAGQAKDLVNELNTEYAEQDRAFEIWEIAGGYQIRTRAEFSGYLQKLQKERALRLSQAALETLAIIAYRQPATRAEIEEVRGVDAGATVKSLLDRQLIRIAGQREVPGRPMLYGTTRRFLEVFGLENLKNLPTLRELDEMAREQGLLQQASDDALAPEASSLAVEGDAETQAVVPEGPVEDSAADSLETVLDDEVSTVAEQDPEVVEVVDVVEVVEVVESAEGAGVVEVIEVADGVEAVDVASDERSDDIDGDPAER
jgi:segregation and condensation protein B